MDSLNTSLADLSAIGGRFRPLLRGDLQIELEVFDVGEQDLFQASGAATAVLEVDLFERFGGDLLELGVAGAGLLGVEEPGGVAGREGDGQVPDAVLVRRPDRRDVAEPGPGVDDDAACRRCLLPGLGPDLRLPALLHLALQARGEVRSGLLDLVLHVPFDGALGDPQHLGDRFGALELLDQVPHLRARALGRWAGERLLHRGVQAVPEQAHRRLPLLSVVDVGDGAVLDVPGQVELRSVEPLADLFAPQDALGALVLDQAGVDAELEAARQRLALLVGQEVQRAGAVGGVDDAVGQDRDRVLAGEGGVLDDLAVQVDPRAGDARSADVRPPRRAGQRPPRLARPPALTARALAQLAQAALHRRLDRRDDDRQLRVPAAVAVHRRHEVGRFQIRVDTQVGHRGEVRVAQPVVPAVQVPAALVPDVRLQRAHFVAELHRIRDGGRRVPGRALGALALRRERAGQ